jgi:hypothetical protein
MATDIRPGMYVSERPTHEWVLVENHILNKVSGTGYFITECNLVIEPKDIRFETYGTNKPCKTCHELRINQVMN